jgi:general stress protein 26
MNEEQSRQEAMDRLGDLIQGIRTAMLTTMGPVGYPRSRPMATLAADFSGTIWFFTSVNSRKVGEIGQTPQVAVTYSSPGKESYVALTGEAAVVEDSARAHAMWNPLHKAWFTGPDDPTLRLVRIDVHEAEYWDTPGGKIASFLQLAKAAITGDRKDMEDDNVKVRLN